MESGLVLWLSLVDDNDCLCIDNKEAVLKAKNELTGAVKCDAMREMKEYVGCKIEHDSVKQWLKLTQTVTLYALIHG